MVHLPNPLAAFQLLFGRVSQPAIEGAIRYEEIILYQVLINIHLRNALALLTQYDVLHPHHLQQCVPIIVCHIREDTNYPYNSRIQSQKKKPPNRINTLSVALTMKRNTLRPYNSSFQIPTSLQLSEGNAVSLEWAILLQYAHLATSSTLLKAVEVANNHLAVILQEDRRAVPIHQQPG